MVSLQPHVWCLYVTLNNGAGDDDDDDGGNGVDQNCNCWTSGATVVMAIFAITVIKILDVYMNVSHACTYSALHVKVYDHDNGYGTRQLTAGALPSDGIPLNFLCTCLFMQLFFIRFYIGWLALRKQILAP